MISGDYHLAHVLVDRSHIFSCQTLLSLPPLFDRAPLHVEGCIDLPEIGPPICDTSEHPTSKHEIAVIFLCGRRLGRILS